MKKGILAASACAILLASITWISNLNAQDQGAGKGMRRPSSTTLPAPTDCSAQPESSNKLIVDVSWKGSASQNGGNARIERQYGSTGDSTDWNTVAGGDDYTSGSPFKDDQSAEAHWMRYRLRASQDGKEFGDPSNNSDWVYRGGSAPSDPKPSR